MSNSLKHKLLAAFFFIAFIGLANNASAQTTIYKFKSADGSNHIVKYTISGDDLTSIHIGYVGDAAWTTTSILKKDYDNGHYRIKSSKSGRIYELDFDYHHPDKMYLTQPDGKKVTYYQSN